MVVPRWRVVRKYVVASKLRSSETTIRCALLEIGSNSVIPCMKASIMCFEISILTILYQSEIVPVY